MYKIDIYFLHLNVDAPMTLTVVFFLLTLVCPLSENPDLSTITENSVWIMVFNSTFNNISAISWQSVYLVEGTRVPGENHRPVASH